MNDSLQHRVTAFCTRFGLRRPILLAPMAGGGMKGLMRGMKGMMGGMGGRGGLPFR